MNEEIEARLHINLIVYIVGNCILLLALLFSHCQQREEIIRLKLAFNRIPAAQPIIQHEQLDP